MIRLTGHAIDGLDEFMLRMGHLKVVANVAAEIGGATHRVQRATAELLTSLVHPTPQQLPALAEYLVNKHLCYVDGPNHGRAEDADVGNGYRYPDFIASFSESSGWTLTSRAGGEEGMQVWWQDLCLSDARVPSKVGAITSSAKSGSKTGLSHIFDWAEMLGLISKSAQVSPEGRLIAKLGSQTKSEGWLQNPYILGNERLVLGFVLVRADTDIFSRLTVAMHEFKWPLKKKDAGRLFASTVLSVVDESDTATYLTSRQRFILADLMRDLQRAARGKSMQLGDTSTAWHRISSRLESYVDLGILQKDADGKPGSFEYIYYPTQKLSLIVSSLKEFSDPDEWIDRRLISCLLGRETSEKPLDRDSLRPLLPQILRAINTPAAALAIDTVALGIIQTLADLEHPPSFGAARLSVEQLAREHEDIARLARGTSGQRAEFITINIERL